MTDISNHWSRLNHFERNFFLKVLSTYGTLLDKLGEWGGCEGGGGAGGSFFRCG
jgi:hypothetical protein